MIPNHLSNMEGFCPRDLGLDEIKFEEDKRGFLLKLRR